MPSVSNHLEALLRGSAALAGGMPGANDGESDMDDDSLEDVLPRASRTAGVGSSRKSKPPPREEAPAAGDTGGYCAGRQVSKGSGLLGGGAEAASDAATAPFLASSSRMRRVGIRKPERVGVQTDSGPR